MADDDRNSGFRSSSSTHWTQSPRIYSHSHHGTPAQEYQGFNFTSPQMAMEPSAFSNNAQQRPIHQHLQPLVMPQWPSMLGTQAQSSYQPMYAQPVQPIQSVQPLSAGPLHTPVSATSTRSASTPRKTLTDLDRKRMCQYAEEHPNSKQTEIGTIFGVERSTVSKVLRQKEKYLLQQEDGSRSPAKRPKGRSPDIERALANWARNQEKKGNPLTDELIRRQARAFSTTTTTTTSPEVTLSSNWLEKFKLKNNLMGARSRKASLADELESASAIASNSQSPGDNSPISPSGAGSPSPLEIHSVQSHESLKHESPDDYIGFGGGRHVPFHSQSTNSLNSAFTDTAPSSFSPGPLSPTSPFFTSPDSGTAPSPFVHNIPGRALLPAMPENLTDPHRPRSLTFSHLELGGLPNTGVDPPTQPGYSNTSAMLDSPTDESSHSHQNRPTTQSDDHHRPQTMTPSEMMRPPPLPAHLQQQLQDSNISSRRDSQPPITTTSPDEARRALYVVLSFVEQQPHGFLDLQESVTIGKLMEKLKLHSRGGP